MYLLKIQQPHHYIIKKMHAGTSKYTHNFVTFIDEYQFPSNNQTSPGVSKGLGIVMLYSKSVIEPYLSFINI